MVVEMRQLVRASLKFLSHMIQTPLHGARQARSKLTDSKDETKQRESGAALRNMPGVKTSTSPVALSVECTNPYEMNNALETFVSYPRCFTLDEFMGWLDADVTRNEASAFLLGDPRFICLHSQMPEEHFIPEATLFRWWGYLSLRLARAHEARLDEGKLAKAVNSLRLIGRWDKVPGNAMEHGQRYGFVRAAWTSGQYVFPVARLLSFATPHSTEDALTDFKALAEEDRRYEALKERLERAFQRCFATLNRIGPRHSHVLRAREGLLPGGRQTLEQIGTELGLTRERIRQIEASAWKRMRHPSRRPFFLMALLYSVMNRHGSLIVDKGSTGTLPIAFIAKCAGIPLAEMPNTDCLVLCASATDMAKLQSYWQFPAEATPENIAGLMEADGQLCLGAKDIESLAEALARHRLEHLNKAQRVYLAVRGISKPAHYSEVAKVYNSMFPADVSTEHSIHAILDRERHGVVWTGARGMYALKEWGYDRPSKGLFEAVTVIVNNRYKETGKPVPRSVIVAEIGKHRQVVRPNSLVFAILFNAGLRRVPNDCFVPKEPGDELQEELKIDELDRILREFERQGDQ